LGREPIILPDSLWDLLKKYDLIQEPQAELLSHLQVSPETPTPSTLFARAVDRSFRALLTSDPRTKDIRVHFCHREDVKIDLAFSNEEMVLYVHSKWLEVEMAHTHQVCPAKSELTDEVFFCDHVVEELYRRAIMDRERIRTVVGD
jgi:hypothetical protein